MNIIRTQVSTVLGALLLLSASAAMSAQGPKYKANVPASVTTPDKVYTELLGDLDFFDGMPSKTTIKKAYDFLDTARGAEAFLKEFLQSRSMRSLKVSRKPASNPVSSASWKN